MIFIDSKVKRYKGIIYYSEWNLANEKRKKGNRVYYQPGMGYYIVKTEKKSFRDSINVRALLVGMIIGFLLVRITRFLLSIFS